LRYKKLYVLKGTNFPREYKKNVQDIAHQILPQIFSQIFQLPF